MEYLDERIRQKDASWATLMRSESLTGSNSGSTSLRARVSSTDNMVVVPDEEGLVGVGLTTEQLRL